MFRFEHTSTPTETETVWNCALNAQMQFLSEDDWPSLISVLLTCKLLNEETEDSLHFNSGYHQQLSFSVKTSFLCQKNNTR